MSFRYYNTNPNGYHIPDCVIRAIMLGLNLQYYDVVEMLQRNGENFQCDCLNKQCYEKLLDFDFKIPHFVPTTQKTVQEVAEDFKEDILIIRIEGHLTTAIRGEVFDIWDCSQEVVTDFWIA